MGKIAHFYTNSDRNSTAIISTDVDDQQIQSSPRYKSTKRKI